MLKYYYVIAHTMRNGKEVSCRLAGKKICEETESYSVNLTWTNLTSFYQEHGLDCAFTIYHYKKGRYISFFDFNLGDKNTWDIREWKYKELNVSIYYEYREIKNYSIQDILQYHNAVMAKKFLQQIGGE